MPAVIDLGDEVLIAREDHDDDQRPRQRQINQRQQSQDHLRFRRGERGLGNVHELEQELDEQHEQGQRETEIERR